MGRLPYYVVWIIASYAFQYPPLLAGIVVFFLLRQWIPDPWVWFRTAGRIGGLNRQIAANPQNAQARRDLAMIYLDRLRPGRALVLADEALARFPNDAELLYLKGVAHARRREYAASLEPLVRSVELDPRLRFGLPYLMAGDSLYAVGRFEEAVDAFDRALQLNSSSIEALFKRARAHDAAKEADAAKADLDEALRTFWQLPNFLRRKQFTWWVRAHFAKLIGFL